LPLETTHARWASAWCPQATASAERLPHQALELANDDRRRRAASQLDARGPNQSCAVRDCGGGPWRVEFDAIDKDAAESGDRAEAEVGAT
jgi:hypothetical protein